METKCVVGGCGSAGDALLECLHAVCERCLGQGDAVVCGRCAPAQPRSTATVLALKGTAANSLPTSCVQCVSDDLQKTPISHWCHDPGCEGPICQGCEAAHVKPFRRALQHWTTHQRTPIHRGLRTEAGGLCGACETRPAARVCATHRRLVCAACKACGAEQDGGCRPLAPADLPAQPAAADAAQGDLPDRATVAQRGDKLKRDIDVLLNSISDPRPVLEDWDRRAIQVEASENVGRSPVLAALFRQKLLAFRRSVASRMGAADAKALATLRALEAVLQRHHQGAPPDDPQDNHHQRLVQEMRGEGERRIAQDSPNHAKVLKTLQRMYFAVKGRTGGERAEADKLFDGALGGDAAAPDFLHRYDQLCAKRKAEKPNDTIRKFVAKHLPAFVAKAGQQPTLKVAHKQLPPGVPDPTAPAASSAPTGPTNGGPPPAKQPRIAPADLLQDPPGAPANAYEEYGEAKRKCAETMREMAECNICPNCHVKDAWVGSTETSAQKGAADKADYDTQFKCAHQEPKVEGGAEAKPCGMIVHHLCSLPQLSKKAVNTLAPALRCPAHQSAQQIRAQLDSDFLVRKEAWAGLSGKEKGEVVRCLLLLNQLVSAAEDTVLFDMGRDGGLSFLRLRRKVAALEYTDRGELLRDLRTFLDPALWHPNTRAYATATQLAPFLKDD